MEDDRILWKSDLEEEQATSLILFYPRFLGKVTNAEGYALCQIFRGFFPLQKGNVFSFMATVDTDQPPYAWEYSWQCETMAAQMRTTPVGEFLTYKIACGRDGKTELVFYYAPEIGYYVQMEIYDVANDTV